MVWKSAAGEGAAAGFATKVKMSEPETSAFGFPKVSRRRWTSGGAPEPLVRLPPPPPVGLGRLGAVEAVVGMGMGRSAGSRGSAAVDAPGSGDAVSAPPGCSLGL